MFTEAALHSAPCVGHILKMLLIFFLIMDIMPLYKAGLDAQIDYLFSFFSPAYICWQCVGLCNYEEVKEKEVAANL